MQVLRNAISKQITSKIKVKPSGVYCINKPIFNEVNKFTQGHLNPFSSVCSSFLQDKKPVWKRPQDVPVPTVWHTFDGKKRLEGKIPKFIVQDITNDMVEEILDITCEHFINDEPILQFSDFRKCEKSMKILRAFWKQMLEDEVGLVCIHDDGDKKKIAGCYLTNVVCIENKNRNLITPDAEKWNAIIQTYILSYNTCNVFEKYGVDKYMSGTGLTVLPEYRGQNIGLELLKARVPLCKAVGVKVNATVFTATISQVLAHKGGYEVLGEVNYADLEDKYGIRYPGITTPCAKLMSLEVD